MILSSANGIMKTYTKTEEVDVIWIKFNDSKIGHCQAKKLAFLYIDHISKDWIPILRIKNQYHPQWNHDI